jgi:hypothetical protein
MCPLLAPTATPLFGALTVPAMFTELDRGMVTLFVAKTASTMIKFLPFNGVQLGFQDFFNGINLFIMWQIIMLCI